MRDVTSGEEWRARERARIRWLVAIVFAVGMLLGSVVGSVVLACVVVVVACAGTAWTFRRHMALMADGVDSRE